MPGPRFGVDSPILQKTADRYTLRRRCQQKPTTARTTAPRTGRRDKHGMGCSRITQESLKDHAGVGGGTERQTLGFEKGQT